MKKERDYVLGTHDEEISRLGLQHRVWRPVVLECWRARSLTNVHIHELDVMTDELPAGPFDFSWCRWVAEFVSDPALLIKKIAGSLKKNGVGIFHEYAGYETWRFAPPRP